MLAPGLVPNSAVRNALRLALENGRRLDSGNAGPGNLGTDWARLGATLWGDLYAAYPSLTTGVKTGTDAWTGSIGHETVSLTTTLP